MNLKTKIAAIIFMALFCTSAASAESIPECGVAEDGIRAQVSGTIDMHDFGYSDTQLKKRIPYMPLQVELAVSDPETGELLYANQTSADDSGAYKVELLLSKENGTYNLKIYTPYCKVYDGTMEYSDGTVSMFNETAAAGDDQALEDYMYRYAGCLNLDLSKYKQLADNERKLVLKNMIEKIPFDKKANLGESVSNAVFKAGLISETMSMEEKSKMFCEYLDNLGEAYEGITGFVKTNNLAAADIELYNAGDYPSVESAIYDISLKAYLKNNVQNIYDLEVLFTDNLFSLSDSTMAKYNECKKKTEFFTALNKQISNINTTGDFHTAVGIALEDASKPDVPSVPSGGGGGGGGKTTYTIPSSAVTTPAPTVATPEPTNNDEKIFSDMTNYKWAEEAVRSLTKLGVIEGDGSGRFMPDKSITREEFAQIISGAFKLQRGEGADNGFIDVKESDWYYEAVMKCVANGITTGISETEFGIGRNITRQEAATMLARAMGIDVPKDTPTPFTDDEKISDYAKNIAYALKEKGIIGGYDDGSFGPGLNMSRAEAAKMIYEAIRPDEE